MASLFQRKRLEIIFKWLALLMVVSQVIVFYSAIWPQQQAHNNANNGVSEVLEYSKVRDHILQKHHQQQKPLQQNHQGKNDDDDDDDDDNNAVLNKRARFASTTGRDFILDSMNISKKDLQQQQQQQQPSNNNNNNANKLVGLADSPDESTILVRNRQKIEKNDTGPLDFIGDEDTTTKQITPPSNQRTIKKHQQQDDESTILVRNRQKIEKNDTGPLDFIEEYDLKAIREDRRTAEESFVRQSGYLWMQHARKAGGTTLCMTLLLNQMGLIRSHKEVHKYGKRQTCQITKLCNDCNIKKKVRKMNAILTPNLSSMVKRGMDKENQNFIEIEGSGVPNDMLDSSLWGEFVFVSTVRHPIGRLVSLLNNDICMRSSDFIKDNPSFAKSQNLKKHGGNKTTCMEYEKNHIASNSKRCDESIYFCHSNYLVRIFSGLDTQYTNDTHMLETAKRNFQRFSCVPIIEHFQETSHCLKRFGLFLTNPGPEVSFNVAGNKTKSLIADTTRVALESSSSASSSYNAFAADLSHEQYLNALLVNKADIEFYEWVVNFHGSLFND